MLDKLRCYLPVYTLLSLVLLVACGKSTQTLSFQATIQPTTPEDRRTPIPIDGPWIGITFLPLATWSPTPIKPTKTPIPTGTTRPTSTSTPTRLPTFTPFPPYTTKQVLLDYYISGNHTPYDFFLDYTYSNLVLYPDGQLIVVGKTYKQKILSENERNKFLSKLDTLGFYRINSNQHHDPTDHLYNFGDQYGRVDDAINYCVLVEGVRPRSLCVYEPYKKFLVPEMKNVLEFLDNYSTEGMTPYYPDRILLWVQVGRNSYDNNLPGNIIDWPKNFPSLSTGNSKIMFVDGKTAREVYSLYGNTITGKVFKENDIEYTVYPQIVMPHEELRNEGP